MTGNIDKNGIEIHQGDDVIFNGMNGVVINQYVTPINTWKVLVRFGVSSYQGDSVIRSNEVEVVIEDPIKFKSILPV